jgi:hypothetical protein
MPTAISRSAAAMFCACLLHLTGCGEDTGSNQGSVYAGAGAVGGMGLGGNIGNPDLNMGVTGGIGGGGSGGMSATGGTGAVAGMMAMTGGMGGTGGMMTVTGGMGGGGGTMTMTGGMGGMAGSGGMMAMTGGTTGGNPDDELNEVRQVCVDTINEYRATLDLPPLARATPEQEVCSDNGAMMDAEAMDAHGSAGMCDLGSQNTCPGYPVSFGGGTLAGVLKRCLQQMWDEGEPPVPRAECRGSCFLEHGHYLNMSDPNATDVGCGFYDMGGDTWWMNQNFKVVWRR